MRVFDVHTHIYPEAIAERAVSALGKFYDFVPEGLGTYDDLVDIYEGMKPDGFLILCVATNSHQVEKVNDFVAEKLNKARAAGFEAHGFMGMHQDHPDKLGECERCAALGFDGLKIHPDIQGVNITDERFYPVYEWLEKNGKAVYFHMGDNRPQYLFSKPAQLAQVAADFPHLRIGAAHMGGYMETADACAPLAELKNIWYDLSSTMWYRPSEHTDRLIRLFGVEKIMFGTDYPVKRLPDELGRFMKLDLDASEREKILWDNALTFLQCKL